MALNFAFRFPSNRKFFSKINGPQKFQHPFKQNSNFITNKPQFLTFRSFSSPSEQDIQIFRKKCLFHSRYFSKLYKKKTKIFKMINLSQN